MIWKVKKKTTLGRMLDTIGVENLNAAESFKQKQFGGFLFLQAHRHAQTHDPERVLLKSSIRADTWF